MIETKENKEQLYQAILAHNGIEKLAKITSEELSERIAPDVQAFIEHYIMFASKLAGAVDPGDWLKKIGLEGYKNLVNNMAEELSKRLQKKSFE